MATVQFEAGKTYKMTFIGDSELKTPVKVISISASRKTAMIQVRKEKPVRKKIYTFQGVESIDPLGRYSMSPSIEADSLMIVEEPKVEVNEAVAESVVRIEDTEENMIELTRKVINLVNSTSGEIQEGWKAFLLECLGFSISLREEIIGSMEYLAHSFFKGLGILFYDWTEAARAWIRNSQSTEIIKKFKPFLVKVSGNWVGVRAANLNVVKKYCEAKRFQGWNLCPMMSTSDMLDSLCWPILDQLD